MQVCIFIRKGFSKIGLEEQRGQKGSMSCKGAMRSQSETYSRYSWLDDEKQKKVLGVFNGSFFSNVVRGVIAFYKSV